MAASRREILTIGGWGRRRIAARVSAASFGNPVGPPHGARESLRPATSLEAQCAITSLRIDLAQF